VHAMRVNCFGLLALGTLLSGCSSVDTAPTTEERLALAPTGKLRAAMVITNPVHATKDPSSGEMKGIAIDLGKEMARRLGVPFEVVGYSGGAALIASATSGQWDIAFIGVPRRRNERPIFTDRNGLPRPEGLADLASIRSRPP
jgi:polar amino acid transport system substrate-binding protein